MNIRVHRRKQYFFFFLGPGWEITQKNNEMQSLCPVCSSELPLQLEEEERVRQGLQLREEERKAEVAASGVGGLARSME